MIWLKRKLMQKSEIDAVRLRILNGERIKDSTLKRTVKAIHAEIEKERSAS